MDDDRIINLYWQRDERAIAETDRKYGGLCSSIAYGILANHQDSEECVSDTYMSAWNSIPPQRPKQLKAYLGRIVRNLSLNRARDSRTKKRGGGEVGLIFDELENMIAANSRPEKSYEEKELAQAINAFVAELSGDDRLIFLYRYWMAQPVAKIAARFRCKPSRVNSSLHRSRKKLRAYLIKEGLL